MSKARFCFRIDPDLLDHLKKVAESEHRTLSNLIEATLYAVFDTDDAEEET